MSAVRSSLRALPTTCVVFLVQLAFAAAITLPALPMLTTLLPPGGGALARAASLDSLRLGLPALGVMGSYALASLLGWMLLSPWLHMSWLSALSAPQSLGAALVRGARLYVRALLVTLVLVVVLALLCTPWAFTAWLVSRYIDPQTHVRAHDLGIAIALSPALLTLAIGHVWHELARARAALERPVLRCVSESARQAVRPFLLLRWAVFALSGSALVAAAELWARPAIEGHSIHAGLVASAVQLAVFARVYLRSLWLSDALASA